MVSYTIRGGRPGREGAGGDDGEEEAGAVGAADVDGVDGGERRHVERRGADDVQPDPVTGLEPVADRPQLHVVAPGLTDAGRMGRVVTAVGLHDRAGGVAPGAVLVDARGGGAEPAGGHRGSRAVGAHSGDNTAEVGSEEA